MDYHDYCREISSWIDPFLLRDANVRLISASDKALDRGQICLGSSAFKSPNEACFRELIEKYLMNFYVPNGIIDLANLDNSFSPEVIRWLLSLRFNGRIYDAPKDIKLPDNRNPLLIVEERDLFLDIIIQPLSMLTNIISKCAQTWNQAAQVKEPKLNAFLKHSSPGSLMVYIESKVAVSYGFDSAANCGVEIDSGTTIFGYRYVGVAGRIKSLKDEIFIKVAQKAASTQAELTKSN